VTSSVTVEGSESPTVIQRFLTNVAHGTPAGGDNQAVVLEIDDLDQGPRLLIVFEPATARKIGGQLIDQADEADREAAS
jgi:hypothetical protein